MDRATGVVLNPNFETYKLPNGADVPEIQIVLLDMPERGVIGVGEPCHIPTAAAIANAIANAIGVRVNSLPITPDKILAALGKLPARKTADAAIMDEAFAFVRALPATVVEEFEPATLQALDAAFPMGAVVGARTVPELLPRLGL